MTPLNLHDCVHWVPLAQWTKHLYSILNMHSEDPVGQVSDLTAAARLRDRAIALVAREGFTVPLRRITEAAGVSPGLVSHHFGSKDGLLETCDAHVLTLAAEGRERMVAAGDYRLLEFLAAEEGSQDVVGYLVQALLAGNPLGRRFAIELAADAEAYLAAGVDAGRMRPSRDARARADYLAMSQLGATLLHIRLELASGPDSEPDFPAIITDLSRRHRLPSLELFTQGLLVDDSLLSKHLDTADSGARGPGLE